MSHIKEMILREDKQQIIKYLIPRLKDDNVIITVNRIPELPAADFVQVDFLINGKNIISTNPENLINLGFKIPETKKLLTLPTGKYKISDLKGKLFNENSELLMEKHKRPDGKKARSFIAVFRYNPSIEVLLVSDKKGRWTMPGGQLDMKENYEDAAWRELKEETGVVPKDLIHWRKIESGDKITDIYYTVVPADQKAKAGSDAKGVKWASIDKLDGVKNFHRIVLNNLTMDILNTKNKLEESIKFLESIGISSKELLTERKRTIDGYLIVMEGIDGAGKSTQCDTLEKWLHDKGWKVTVSKWNSSPHITDAIKKGKKERWLSPTLFSLLNASDMVWRYENVIKPALDKGHVVICDRFYYTSYVRDSLRGVPDALLNEIYKNFPEPDLVVHFLVPPELAMERLMKDKGVKYYSAGRDIGYHEDEEKCALEYETKMDEVYRKILPKIKNYKAVNSEGKPSIVFKEIKAFVKEKLQKVKRSKFKNLIHEGWDNREIRYDLFISKKEEEEALRAGILAWKRTYPDSHYNVGKVIKKIRHNKSPDGDEIEYGGVVHGTFQELPVSTYVGIVIKKLHRVVPASAISTGVMTRPGDDPKLPPTIGYALTKKPNEKLSNASYIWFRLGNDPLTTIDENKSEILSERLSYSDLYDATDDDRIARARTVRVRPLLVTTENNNEMWKFSYTSAERSEYKKYGGNAGHKGNIHFFKDSIEPGDNAEDLDCMVDCDCRDFKFRWAYANAQDDASFIGGKSLNKAINRPPVKTNPERKTQLCKHLAGLAKYLTTNLDRARQRARLRNRPVNIFEEMDNLANKGKFAATYNDHEGLNESVLNEDLYEYFYHATTAEALPSIVKLGLIPSTDTNWGGELGKYSRGKVFVTKNFSTANYYGNIIWRDDPNRYRPILRFKYNKHRFIPDKSSDVDFYVQYPLKGKFEIFVYNEDTKTDTDERTGDTWFQENTGEWRPLSSNIASDIYHGEWDGEIIDDADYVNEEVERVGYDPDEEHSDMPINWDASDVQILDKWNINTIRNYAGLPQTFISIYPAIVDLSDLSPKLAEEDPEYADDEVRGGYDWEEFRFKRRGFPPVLLMRTEDGKLHIMDGNHRIHWAQEVGHRTIGSWIVDKLIQKHIDQQKKKPLKETRIIGPELALEEGYITLYHGTTWPIALQAKKGELGPQNLKKLVTDVLINVFHETPQNAMKIYDDEIKHHSIRSAPTQNILFLTTDKEAAERYAKASTKYGGEIFMDILGQYLWDTSSKKGQDVRELVRQHLLTNEPAIVTINVPLSMVFTHPNWNTPFRDRIRDVLKNIRKHPNLRNHLNDLSMEVFVKEKIPAKFVQRIDRTEKFGEDR